ncbi:hypothetical protein ACOYR1_10910 [Thalassotalea piscium]
MLTRISLLLSLMLISVVSNTASAKLDYVSLHEIESEAHEPLFVRLNIVGSGQHLPLKFTLLSQKIETEMAAHRINTFMVRLASLRPAIGESYIFVYEFDGQSWNKATQVDVSNQLVGDKVDALAMQPKKSSVATTVTTQAEKPVIDCVLERGPKETLWSIASRYKEEWRVDVFSAMIAIFNANQNKFTQQHIGHLMDNEVLVCPSGKTIAMLGEKEAMRAEFSRLNQLPF